MSRNFKKPSSLNPARRREEKLIRFMALLVEDQAGLDKLLAGSTGPAREAMLEKLRPHLRFRPAPETSSAV